MTYSLRFRPEVVGDLEDAAKWYDDRKLGLGGEFLQECIGSGTRRWHTWGLVVLEPQGSRHRNIK